MTTETDAESVTCTATPTDGELPVSRRSPPSSPVAIQSDLDGDSVSGVPRRRKTSCVCATRLQQQLVVRSTAVKATAAGQRVCRKYRRVHIRRLQETEYDKLRMMVPALRALDKRRHRRLTQPQQHSERRLPSLGRSRSLSKVTVIQETIRYIDHLHRTLVERMQSEDMTPAATADKFDGQSVIDTAKMAFILTETSCCSHSDNSGCHGDSHPQLPFCSDLASSSLPFVAKATTNNQLHT